MNNWKQELKQLKLTWMENHHADFFKLSGGWQQKLKSYSDHNTNALTASVYDFIKYSGFYVNRINSQGQMRKINGRMQWTHGSTNKGTADIDCIIDGKPIKIEIKCAATKDRISTYQEQEKQKIEAAGGIYIVVTDMQMFVDWYNEFTCTKTESNIEHSPLARM